ncbi:MULTISPECIES: TetR/AcrR family transcriptional regulator [unclassified Rhodococcus (in: high G+C Gram-positive bacteria)]|uniref:TetR/AcrR family transcriptional regulator n=1 Tax=unclassified Rhodococcus (in: high G+C Gram-positive bacteria) TaxID=192944 RepID=UPI00117A6113|nr:MULTISPECIES: TetR/AcrR family transcriptional regulator [unclassified Rhodococcus (in: high G+C Gram-positive bacteria)]
MRTPVQSRSEGSTARMVAATIELLHEGGLQAVTIAAVAQRYGGSNGSIYHRFGDRTGLLMAAQEDVLTRIEHAAAAAFSAAEQESDDDRAVQMLAEAALAVFAEHRGAMRAFFIQSRNTTDGELFAARIVRTNHQLADTVTGWLSARFGTSDADAEATWRILFAIGASQAVFDDQDLSARSTSESELSDALARAVSAVARRV